MRPVRICIATLLLAAAACRSAPRRPGLDSPSSAPVRETPRRAALITGPHDGDWPAIGEEAVGLLRDYLRINTTNPPGNEAAAAAWLAQLLRREGFEVEVFESAPGRANLVTRLRGNGSARPLVLLHHMDVVEATREFWTTDPFGAEIRDGYLYGRGALDMKGHAVAQLMALITLKRANTPLARDIIFLATADEEAGGQGGAGWVVRHRPDLVRDAEFLLTEGGSMDADAGGTVTGVFLDVSEKAPFWLNVTARGRAGHGSRPNRDNAVERLVRAMGRLAEWDPPLVLTPVAERYFQAVAPREGDPRRRAWLENPRAALADSAARAWLLSDPFHEALLRNTIAVTRLAGSGKVNVIPPVARGEVDVRLLPGQDAGAFLAELRRVVDDTLVAITSQGVTWDATESPLDNAMVGAIRDVTARRFPGVLFAPVLLAGFTDAQYFRRLGIASYGIGLIAEPETAQALIHGNDERILVSAIGPGVRYLYEILVRVAGR